MIKIVILLLLVLLAAPPVFAEAPDFNDLDVRIGNIRIPKAFVHAGKEYNSGIYFVTLKAKDGVPYFNVHNRKKELLFEEMAVLKPLDYKGKAKKFRHRVRKEMLRGYEYYRIKVSRPDSLIMAYLLMKDNKAKASGNKGKENPDPRSAGQEKI
ncbi:MAG: hypothetical protein GY940_19740 [bacterium]|nr:hypothetical protein [bacterium]